VISSENICRTCTLIYKYLFKIKKCKKYRFAMPATMARIKAPLKIKFKFL